MEGVENAGESLYTVVRGQGRKKNNSKNKNRIFEKIIFSKKVFLHGEKDNFEEYSYFWNLLN
jgi:hypothetical protein